MGVAKYTTSYFDKQFSSVKGTLPSP